MKIQRRFRLRLGAIRQHVITEANVDLDQCRHLASLGHDILHVPPQMRNS